MALCGTTGDLGGSTAQEFQKHSQCSSLTAAQKAPAVVPPGAAVLPLARESGSNGSFFCGVFLRPLLSHCLEAFQSTFFSLSLSSIIDLGKLAPLPIPPMILAYL